MKIFKNVDLGLLLLRMGVGIIFILHGYPKLVAGATQWQWLGSQMSLIGVTFLPTFWGFMAAVAETVGGLLIAFGFCSRIASLILTFNMLIALLFHLHAGDGFNQYSHALTLVVVFLALLFVGPGKYALNDN